MPEALRFLLLALAISAAAVLAAPLSVTPVSAEKAKTDADPCAGTKAKSACKNAEAVRGLLRTSDPPSDKAKPGKSGEGVLTK